MSFVCETLQQTQPSVEFVMDKMLVSICFKSGNPMKQFENLFSQKHIENFCQRWNISELALFGSILRDDFSLESDIDVLVSFDQSSQTTLFDMVRMQDELSDLFERNVDLISRKGIEQSKNSLRREEIINSLEVVYAAG
jgi:predicted nucleotidyltransferase